MHTYERRLRRLEAGRRRREIAATAAQYGLTYEQLIEEAEMFFAQPLDAQLAQVDEIAAELQAEGMTMDDIDGIKADLVRYYRRSKARCRS
jgi:hypothetical protein